MITYLEGDVCSPQKETGLRVIAQVVNDIGVMGAGVAKAIYTKWPVVKEQYLKWSKLEDNFDCGNIQIVPVEKDIYVCNMIGQNGIKGPDNPTPINYSNLTDCLRELNLWIENYQSGRFYMGSNFKDPEVSIHIPFIGAGLAGGDWDKIEDLIEHNWDEQEVYVYKFKG